VVTGPVPPATVLLHFAHLTDQRVENQMRAMAGGGTGSKSSAGLRLWAGVGVGVGVLLASLLTTGALAPPVPAGAAASRTAPAGPGDLAAIATSPAAGELTGTGNRAPATVRPHDTNPNCSFDDLPANAIVPDVTPGGTISINCTGWLPDDTVGAFELSPLFLASDSPSDTDQADAQTFTSDGSGDLVATFTVPNPFVASDAAAVCPPTVAQVSSGFLRCGVALTDGVDESPGYVGVALTALDYAAPTGPSSPTATAVGIAATPDGGGYWMAWSSGLVSTFGDALSYGDASSLPLNSPIAHIVPTSDGHGYWLVAGDGGTFAFGDAGFFGSMGGRTLNEPVVDLAPTHDDGGYWLVASDGGIFSFGDATFYGSMGGQTLNQPVVGIATDTRTGGYWEVAADGGIFSFGAPFFGSTGSLVLNQPIVGMTASPSGGGYLFVAADGGVFTFGDASFHGSTGDLALDAPIVGMAVDPATGGYWLVGSDGGVFAFGAPFFGAG
jgi:hypothetical protein